MELLPKTLQEVLKIIFFLGLFFRFGNCRRRYGRLRSRNSRGNNQLCDGCWCLNNASGWCRRGRNRRRSRRGKLCNRGYGLRCRCGGFLGGFADVDCWHDEGRWWRLGACRYLGRYGLRSGLHRILEIEFNHLQRLGVVVSGDWNSRGCRRKRFLGGRFHHRARTRWRT